MFVSTKSLTQVGDVESKKYTLTLQIPGNVDVTRYCTVDIVASIIVERFLPSKHKDLFD